MYNIKQFKPTLYILLLLGMLGYALASESPEMWVLGTGGVLLNAWMVMTGRFRPMPRLLANVVTVASMLYVAREILGPNITPVMVIGKFLVLLQLIKLWEQRANRDYAQLLILSLLLMVAASINTASLVFGILLVVYLFLSLYCCLLFHLKVESDKAKAAFALPADKLSPATLRQDERYLSRSMRRLTGLVSGVAIVMAVIVFVTIPRGAGGGIFGPVQFHPSQTLTGFSDTVSFQQLAKITQNEDEVARVVVKKNGQPVSGMETLWLRGVTLDRYNDKPSLTSGPWQWVRAGMRFEDVRNIDRGEGKDFADDSEDVDHYTQHVTLYPTGTKALFAMAGVVRFTPMRDLKVRFTRADGVLQTDEELRQPVEYEVVSTKTLPRDDPPKGDAEATRVQMARWLRINPRVYEYAAKADVSGTEQESGKPLAQLRPREAYVTKYDREIAENIQSHLKSTFTYTLDLTDAGKLKRDEDPLVAFLYDLKRGHCEYFAGAMTLMCQSMGIQARIVNGFKCDDYNSLGGWYIVKQSHAHSWVEVLTSDGWKTFDPTTSREDQRPELTAWQAVKHFFDYLEFTYANAVIAYDNDHRDSLIADVEARMQNTTYAGADVVKGWREWFDLNRYSLSSTAIGAFMTLMIAAMFAFVIWFLWERWMLRRRAARIGLESLPTSDQLRLVRQLGFYDDLMQLLSRHHITRPRHLTPLEFSQSLSFLPNESFDTIRRLTELFYKVRYGNAQLSSGIQRRLGNVIGRLGAAMDSPGCR